VTHLLLRVIDCGGSVNGCIDESGSRLTVSRNRIHR